MAWFQTQQKQFHVAIKTHNQIEKNFLNPLKEKLCELRDGYFFLARMFDETTVELIITADGKIEQMVFVEELIAEAPTLNGWKFTAFKAAIAIENFEIAMNGLRFNAENLFFSPIESAELPDEISVRIYHEDMTLENENSIKAGTFIFLDNFLCELEFANAVDNVLIEAKNSVKDETIYPIAKLKDYITCRQKEFIETYDGIGYVMDDKEYSIFESQLKNGDRMIATINLKLLNWDAKSSHPWMRIITLYYDGSKLRGMPSKEQYTLLDTIEDEWLNQLNPAAGNLNIGRKTGQNQRQLFFASKDYRFISKVLDQCIQTHQDKFKMKLAIYKDKYWQSYSQYIRKAIFN